MLQKTRSKQRY